VKKKNSKWELIEEVVSILEKAISPDSQVEHNVLLPDLTESSKKRQCDVVIRSGRPPRETITIVEVQDRNSKFDITFFDGLCTKMRKVGAQHLVCVSRKEFPESIIREAKKQGPTVRLVTLKELHDSFPVNFIENCIYVSERNILEIIDVKIGVEKGCLPPSRDETSSIDESLFVYSSEQNILSMKDLINLYIDSQERLNKRLYEGTISLNIQLPENKMKLWHIKNDIKTEIINLSLNVSVDIKRTKAPVGFLSYKQLDTDGPLAWLMEARYTYKKQEIEIQATLVPFENGLYKFEFTKIPERLKNTLSIQEVH
jgi:hypothetical protein